MTPSEKHKHQVSMLQKAVTSQKTDKMPEADVMELIISYFIPSANTETVTENMLNKFGTVAGAMDADLEYIREAIGDPDAAEFFKLIPMFGTYYRLDKIAGGRHLGNLDDIVEYCTYRFSVEKREILYVILLDTNLKMLGSELISEGDAGGVYADTEKIAQAIFKYGASAYILVHNHPSGQPYPSDADTMLTDKAMKLFDPFNKNLIEHLIITDSGYFPIVQMMRQGRFLQKKDTEYQLEYEKRN